ncbi:MAG: gluconolactonase precursor [Ilumatobacteraceae bacterium]|nr:gluconolactonase precursor [Ilumatobacteraceae bacterium]
MTDQATGTMTLIATGLEFPEGPIVLKDGRVLVVEIKSGTLATVSPDGTVTRVATVGGGPNGAAIGPDGKVYVCNNGGFEWYDIDGIVAPGPQPADYIGGRIQRVDIDTGAVEDLYTECDGHPLRGPNDIVFDTNGGFYFTDLGKSRARDVDKGGIYYALADGSSIRQVVYPLDHPNGIGLSPDGTKLYVAETITGRVWTWDIESPGAVKPDATSPGPGRLLYNFFGYQLLDSMAIDGDGNVCVATLVTGAISVISPDGQLLDQYTVPEQDFFVTNVCFGGEGYRTAYVTSSGRGLLYSMTWPRAGLQLNYEA